MSDSAMPRLGFARRKKQDLIAEWRFDVGYVCRPAFVMRYEPRRRRRRGA